MAQSQIKWKRGDYVRLGQAVAQFNKKINALQSEEKKLYLPDVINYSEQKGRIHTRAELNRVINSLRRFNLEGAEDIYITETGEKITSWEQKELNLQAKIAINTLNKQLKELEKPTESGFSYAQMGGIEARQIKATLKNINEFSQKSKDSFKRTKRRIKDLGTLDYTMYKAIIYRENYMKALEENAYNFENYDILKNKLNSIKNPINFYNYISQSETLTDFFLWYDNNTGTLLYGGFTSNEDAFNYGLEELGLLK